MEHSFREAKPPRYSHFILAVWEERPGAVSQPTWRFSLEDPRSGKRYGFGDLTELVAYLKDWMQQHAGE